MKNTILTTAKRIFSKKRGFVLPFTMFIAAVMLLLSVEISSTLVKQIYFSFLSRQSQAAYYAADNALACTLAIEETYTDENGIGIFPYISTSSDPIADMQATLDYVTDHRSSLDYTPLASSLDDIACSQSYMLRTISPTNFSVSPTVFTRTLPDNSTEDGLTSTFSMRMDLGDGTFRCATVTVDKTPTYRRIIAQGYSLCDRPDNAIERAVINTTLVK